MRRRIAVSFSITNVLQIGSSISAAIAAHGYYAIFILMLLESASIPVPSEVILPLVGYFSAQGQINPVIGFAVATLAAIIGMSIDYYVAYFLGKEVVYKHLHLFHVKRQDIESFDEWFSRNGKGAVFLARLLPVVRGLINFPAGFAEMKAKEFYLYSILGCVLWNIALILFGFYALSISNTYVVIGITFAFGLALYLIYSFSMKKIRRSR